MANDRESESESEREAAENLRLGLGFRMVRIIGDIYIVRAIL